MLCGTHKSYENKIQEDVRHNLFPAVVGTKRNDPGLHPDISVIFRFEKKYKEIRFLCDFLIIVDPRHKVSRDL